MLFVWREVENHVRVWDLLFFTKREGQREAETFYVTSAVRDALIGWTPTDANGVALSGARPCTWAGGKLMDYSNETLLWAEMFMTQHNIGSHL